MPQNFFSWKNIKFLAVLIALVFAFRWSILSPRLVTSNSMYNTLEIGDRVLVSVAAYELRFPFSEWTLWQNYNVQRGDVIILRSPTDPTTDFVKRAIGISGDRVRIEGAKIYVNDQEYSYYNGQLSENWPLNKKEYLVPASTVFVLGDNLPQSLDSRTFGPVPLSFIRGRVLLVLWNAIRDENENLKFNWQRFLHKVH